MSALTIRAARILTAFAAFAPAAQAVTYKATLLHPLGLLSSTAQGASSSSQAGFGSIPADGGGYYDHALVWSGAADSYVDLNPADWRYTYGYDASSNSQVGYGGVPHSLKIHALLWHGTPESVVDLHPAGYDSSFAYGASDTSQVGEGYFIEGQGTINHALLWHGTAASVVDLNPPGFEFSMAWGVWGDSQVGDAQGHAILWHGTAESAVDLNPAAFQSSRAESVWSDSQVGYGTNISFPDPFIVESHALLWHGTAASAVDLNPTGFANSYAFDVAGALQVGHGRGPATNDETHALVWNGTAESAVDLHLAVAALNPVFVNSSATGVAEDGSIVGEASDAQFNRYAVLWTPVPEPAAAALFACGLVLARSMRGRKCLNPTTAPRPWSSPTTA